MTQARVTETNGNVANRIRGCRVTIWTDAGEIVDRFVVPSKFGGKNYCEKHPNGQYGKRYFAALAEAGVK
jgi:hypothetical protein